MCRPFDGKTDFAEVVRIAVCGRFELIPSQSIQGIMWFGRSVDKGYRSSSKTSAIARRRGPGNERAVHKRAWGDQRCAEVRMLAVCCEWDDPIPSQLHQVRRFQLPVRAVRQLHVCCRCLERRAGGDDRTMPRGEAVTLRTRGFAGWRLGR